MKPRFITFACLLLKFASSYMENKQCSWVLDAVEKDNLWKVAPRIIRNGKYFLRIRVKCNGMITSEMLRSLVLTGVNPQVSIETEEFGINHHNARRFSILISSLLIEMGDHHDCGCILMNKTSGTNWANKCFCDGIKPSCSQSQTTHMVAEGINCCKIEKNCSRITELCNPVWVAPLHIPESATALHCEVIDSGIGPRIISHRFTVHLDGFHLSVNDTLHNRLGDLVMQLPSPDQHSEIPVNCLPSLSPVCIIGSLQKANQIIYTNSEFETMHFVKIQFQTTVKNKCVSKQLLSSVEVKGTLSLSDRIYLNTGAGLFEMEADHAKNSGSTISKDYALVLSTCLRHVVGPAQPSGHSVTVLGFGEEQDQEKVYVASPVHGKPSKFSEQKDTNGANACQFLRSQLQNTVNNRCQVITGSGTSVIADSFVVLVKLKTLHTDTYHLLLFKGPSSTGYWRVLFHLPTALDFQAKDLDNWEKIESKFSNQVPQASLLRLSGLSFTAVVCKRLFLWGNALLYSPDGGLSIHWLTSFPGNSTIMVFTSSSFDGSFAFLTDTQEVWIGQSGSANVQRLKSSMGPKVLSPGLYDQTDGFIVSIFYDSDGRLQQIVAEGDFNIETKCIYRKELPIGKIISRQIFAQKQQESISAYKKSKRNPTSCIKKKPITQGHHANILRTCPFARISFEATHDVLFTRRCFYKFEPSFQLGSGLVQPTTALHEYFTRVYSTVDSDCTGISKDSRQAMRDRLPELIYLGRSEWYSFVFYLYLDYDFNVEPSSHTWSLFHLQASFHVSDATALNITSKRIELVPKKTVKYQVTVQDSGLRLPQYRSGEGLTPSSLHIQVWNSGLSCITSYGSRGSLEGSYVLTVMLGCPAGRKVVFDPEASKNASGRKHFCSAVHGVPCFYFYRDFLPVFQLLDLATGQIRQFHGKYILKIVGGGPTYQEIADYTEEEQTKYNYQTTSSMASLIWASKLKTLGDIPVFTSKTNGISWLCGTQSPCADVGPTFPGNAEYYFKLEFSNRMVDADSSNCDFTIRFIIRVHGLPPGSFNPSSVIVLSCIGILAGLILTMFALKRREVKFWVWLRSVFAERIYARCREKLNNLRWKRKVDILPKDIQLETFGRGLIINKDSESDDAVSVDIRGQDTEQPTHSETNA